MTVQVPSYNASSGAVGVRVANTCDAGGSPATRFVQIYPCGGFYMVSPNPSSSEVTVSANPDVKEQSQNTTITELNIYDQQGSLKKHRTFNKVSKASLRIADLPIGVYFIEIVNGTYRERQQLSILK